MYAIRSYYAYFDPAEMDAARQHMQAHDGNTPIGMIMVNRAEVQSSDDETVV